MDHTKGFYKNVPEPYITPLTYGHLVRINVQNT